MSCTSYYLSVLDVSSFNAQFPSILAERKEELVTAQDARHELAKFNMWESDMRTKLDLVVERQDYIQYCYEEAVRGLQADIEWLEQRRSSLHKQRSQTPTVSVFCYWLDSRLERTLIAQQSRSELLYFFKECPSNVSYICNEKIKDMLEHIRDIFRRVADAQCMIAPNIFKNLLAEKREENDEKQNVNDRYLLGEDMEIELDIIRNRCGFYISEIEKQMREVKRKWDLQIATVFLDIIQHQDVCLKNFAFLDGRAHQLFYREGNDDEIAFGLLAGLDPIARAHTNIFCNMVSQHPLIESTGAKLNMRNVYAMYRDFWYIFHFNKVDNYVEECDFENSIAPNVTTLDEVTSLYTRALSITDEIFSDSQFAKRDPLKTPLSIYEEARLQFPTATLTRLTINPLKISLQLDEKGKEIQLAHAVSSFVFRLILLSHLRYQKLGGAQPLDPSRFSLQEEPLRDWEGFAHYMSRYRYRKSGYFLEDLVETYLQGPEDGPSLDNMKKMGLSPEQLKGPFSSPEITDPFSRVIERFKDKEDDPVIVHLRERYPELVDHFFHLEIEAEKQKGPVDNKYTEILKRLESQVKGQPLALQEIAEVLAVKSETENRAFFFVGSNEVERRALVDTVAGLENRSVIKFQITHEDTTDSFFSSIDFNTKPRFLLELEKHPDHLSKKDSICVVKDLVFLFDQIEMGHSTLLQSLYTLFNEKKMSLYYRDEESGNGVLVEYRLENCLLISASHDLCQKEVLDAFRGGKDIRQIGEVVAQRLGNKQAFDLANLVELMTMIPVQPFVFNR